ncbi:Rap1a/Tai family immunity protein [Pluralibacter gergoviae]|uniref:Rap1a/Tai family immunity protein n=1 Tax=Pluralibacter gergoviae TaxID=61647 RepID=UPI000A9299DF|nr:Rap1a/Tai family immunity protein [Pluralibacter gergoviae]
MKLLPATLFAAATMTLSASAIAVDEGSNLLRDPNSLSRNDIQISGEKFLHAWLSKDDGQERLKANMYLMGVMDATEGREWCSYRRAKPGSLREAVYAFFEQLPQQRWAEPAAALIKEALMQELPCTK